LRIGVSVAAATGLSDCRPGASGTIEVVDFDAIRNAVRTADSVKVLLPRACGGSIGFVDAGSAERAVVKLGFH
jgi:hypothetical protein